MAVGTGTALADATLAVSGEATEDFKIPNVNIGALRVLGGVTTFAGAAITTYGGYRNLRAGHYGELAINGADLSATATGLLLPPTLPFAIGYGIGRVAGDLVSLIPNPFQPDSLDLAGVQAEQEALSRAILAGLAKTPGCN